MIESDCNNIIGSVVFGGHNHKVKPECLMMNDRGYGHGDTNGSLSHAKNRADCEELDHKSTDKTAFINSVDPRAEESKKILSRIEKETAGQSHGFLARQINSQLSHLNAEDVAEHDKIEIWATKVGRFLGLAITLAIMAWLIIYLIQSQIIS